MRDDSSGDATREDPSRDGVLTIPDRHAILIARPWRFTLVRAIAFDLDGTLIDSTDAIVASVAHTFEVLEQTAPSR
ncbi:MAG: HAD hydrolase-like protein, partial [Candidatus Hydrogenedentota bacterium]